MLNAAQMREAYGPQKDYTITRPMISKMLRDLRSDICFEVTANEWKDVQRLKKCDFFGRVLIVDNNTTNITSIRVKITNDERRRLLPILRKHASYFHITPHNS